MYDPDFDWDEAEQLLDTVPQRTASEDLECQRLWQWQAHDAQVNQIRRGPEDELYTGCWDSASLRLWRLSNFTEPATGPWLELPVGGFLNDMLEISQRQVLVAVSAGLIPTPGEALKLFDLRELSVRGSFNLPAERVQRFSFHTRGCRALSAWRPSGSLWPSLVGSISKDALAVSRVENGLEECHVVPNPHGLQEVTSLCWGGESNLYSGGTDGTVKAWQLSESCLPLWCSSVATGTWIRKMLTMDGTLVVCHSEGVVWLDPQGSTLGRWDVGSQATGAVPVGHRLVLALGRHIAWLDLRRGGVESVERLLELEASISSLEAHSAAGRINLLAGLKNGVVQALELCI